MPLKVGQIPAATIAAGSIGSTELAAGAVTTAKIAAGAVTNTELASNAVTQPKIAADVVGNTYEERFAALATTTTSQAMCGTGLGFTPAADSKVTLRVNGLADYTPSYSAKTGDFYWSADGGTTAKSLAALAAGDIPYSGTKASTYCISLVTSDEISYQYPKSVT